MTQTGASNTIVNVMLGWLKGLASWVLRLFNLSGGISPLRFLANNWLHILVILLIAGVAADLLIWLIRWRPHWVWFRKKRVIINDENFFAGENDLDDEDDWELGDDYGDDLRRRNWRDNDFVVASAARREREARARREEMRRKARAERAEARRLAEEAAEEPTDVFRDGLFKVTAEKNSTAHYEDEVFSVSNLPQREEGAAEARSRSRANAPRGGKKSAQRKGEVHPAAARKRSRVPVNKR